MFLMCKFCKPAFPTRVSIFMFGHENAFSASLTVTLILGDLIALHSVKFVNRDLAL